MKWSDLEVYEPEKLSEDIDDGRMPDNVETLSNLVVGHKIVSARKVVDAVSDNRLELELDDGRRVILVETSDCCAYTEVREFAIHLNRIDHVITGVGTTGGFTKWHIYADLGDILEIDVDWSCGNPFYYGYGFWIHVEEAR